jgi:surfeit locus 1 family protein
VNARLKLVLITVATVLAVGATASMGFWQLSRAAEKQARQAAMEAQHAKAPLSASDVTMAQQPLSLLHQRARLRGRWQSASVIFLENRPMDGRVGFLVLMPFVLEGSQTALVVQRGWVPRGMDDRTRLPIIATSEGIVEIEGRMALPPSDLFALGGPTTGLIRQNLDLPQWRVEAALPLLPITLQQTGTNSEGLVREWPAVNLGVEKNFGYAFQWFGMSLLFVVLFVWFQVIRRIKTRPKEPKTHV